MKRRGHFFIAFIAAAITFGSLTAFVNPRYSGMRYDWRWHRHGYYNRYNPYRNDLPPYYINPDSAYRNYHQPENLQHQ